MNAQVPESDTDPFAGSQLLRVIAEGTAAATGDEFFRSLARHAAQALRARYAFVARSLSDLESKSLAYWEGSDFGSGFSYRFPGTPCQNVAAGHVCVTKTGLRERFPEDRWLTDIGADSYIGVPLKNSAGRTLGHIAVLHTEPKEASEEEIAVLQIFAARACAELERLQADEAVHRRSLEQEAVLAVNRAVGRHLERAELFAALAACLQDVLGHDRFGIELPLEGDRLEGHLLSSGGSGTPVTRLKVLSVTGTACHWVMENRQWFVASTRDELVGRFPATFSVMADEGMESLAALPLVSGDRALGVLFFMAAARGAYDQVRRGFIEQVAGAVAAALDNCLAHEELRRQSKLALSESEERFRDLFDEAPIAYVNEGLDSRFIRANRAALRILGLRPDEVPETYGKSFVPDTPDAQRRLNQAFDSIGRGTDTNGIVLELRRRDNGKAIWIQWWSRPSPDGQYTRTMFIDITERVLIEQERTRLEAQNTYLQEEILAAHNFTEIVGQSSALRHVLEQVDQVAPTNATVLILGETGTGKELIARAIHDRSPRRGRPLVKVNCGAISAGLVESELFGHVKGAFTGALAARDGRFKLADGGTLFLDEVGELPIDTQVKILRVLQEQEFEPIGGNRSLRVDVRLIAATNRDLGEAILEGKFRRDLYYRLNVFPVTLPPLRDRGPDIPLLAMFFLQKFSKQFNRPVRQISDSGLRALSTYSWPGNIRELQNIIERAVVLSRGPVLELPAHFGAPLMRPLTSVETGAANETPTRPLPKAEVALEPVTDPIVDNTLVDVERRHIERILQATQWRIEGPGGAAERLNLRPSSLRSRMQKLGLKRIGPPAPR